MHSTNYFDTFIATADDSPVHGAEVPPLKTIPSSARIHYDMVIAQPYTYTSDDVIYAASGERRGVSRADFFAKPQACLRSSPLTKRYGWGIHSDKDGKIALYPVDSAGYQKLLNDSGLKQLKGMRSKRAAA